MKVSAALQFLTTVMSSGSQDEWPQQLDNDVNTNAGRDLDLGACLDVETLDELSQNLYTDSDTHPDNAWVENVIDMTSSGEITSSGEHAGIVPNSEDKFLGAFSFMDRTTSLDFNMMDSFGTTDNASFVAIQNLTSSTEVNSNTAIPAQVDSFAQFSGFGSTSAADTNPTSTVDLTALGQLMVVDDDASSQQDATETPTTGNIPNALWNLDLSLSASVNDHTVPASTSHQNVKESLKNRLHSRNSVTSLSQDSNDTLGCSTRSLSSSTSSLTQSFEEEESEDPVKQLEKREKNRLAAQRCRNKKRDKTETLQKNVSRLEERQERLKEEVQKLRDERETLEEIINVHGIVCPKIRKISNS